MKTIEKLTEEYVSTQYIDYGDWSWKAEEQIQEGFIAGYNSAKEENSRVIEYLERKYGIVVNREDLNNFIERL